MKKRLKVIIITQYFYPDIAATGQLLTELAEDLQKFGCDVLVYTAQPTYGEKYMALRNEVYKGIKIYRVISSKMNKDLKIGRILNSMTFFVSILFRMFSTSKDYTLLITSNPPFLPLVGWIMKKLRRQKYLFLVHDVYPDIAVRLGYMKEEGIVVKLWSKVNKLIFKKTDKIIVLGNCMKKAIQSSIEKQMDGKIKVIPNWADENFIRPLEKKNNWFAKKYSLIDKMVVLYSGNIGLFQHFETMIEAAERLSDKNVEFLFIGDGGKRAKLERLVRRKRLTNIRFLLYQPRENLPYSLTCADISLVPLEKGAEGLGVPSKIYNIMASGRPVLALVGKNCEVADIIEKSGCGFRCDQDDVDGVVKILSSLYEDQSQLKIMGNKARRYFEEHYTRSKITRKYFDLLESLI